MPREQLVNNHYKKVTGILFFLSNKLKLYVVDEKSWLENGHKYKDKFDVLLPHLRKCKCWQKIIADVDLIFDQGYPEIIAKGERFSYRFEGVLTEVYVR